MNGPKGGKGEKAHGRDGEEHDDKLFLRQDRMANKRVCKSGKAASAALDEGCVG